MILNPNLISHNNFHNGYWLKTNDCDWFFFYETQRDHKIPTNNKFYSTLDDDLKDLVVLFHKNGISTTPSCSGHITDQDYHNNIFTSLLKTTKSIQNDGINLINPESNKRFFYQNPKYSLPFQRSEFIDQMKDYQKKGVLGFVDDRNLYEKLENRIPCEKKDDITLIYSEGDTPRQISRNWKSIEKLIRENLD